VAKFSKPLQMTGCCVGDWPWYWGLTAGNRIRKFGYHRHTHAK